MNSLPNATALPAVTPPSGILSGWPYHIVLASASPRRQQLLRGLDVPFTVEPVAGVDEHRYPEALSPSEIPCFLARAKMDAFPRTLAPNELVITADTLVFASGSVLGKPANPPQARAMLQQLSGATHEVITGVYLRSGDGKWNRGFSDTTRVTFMHLTESQIDYYVSRYHPLDKAGAYGAQEWIGYVGILSIEGSYFNVMGLPVHKLWEELKIL